MTTAEKLEEYDRIIRFIRNRDGAVGKILNNKPHSAGLKYDTVGRFFMAFDEVAK